MITIKNALEIANITRSCEILAAVKAFLKPKMVAGISGLALDTLAEAAIRKHGARPAFKGYHGFAHTICLSFNEEMIHGIPSTRQLQNGDLVKLDIGCVYKGMHSDLAFTKVIGPPTPEDKMLIDTAKKALVAGVQAIRPGARVGDVSAAIGQVVRRAGLYVPRNFSGHGIGYQLHEDPYVHNRGTAQTGPLLRDGMTICIEPMILQKSHQVTILKDGWTVVANSGLKTAHYEHTVLIKAGQGIILTKGKADGKRRN